MLTDNDNANAQRISSLMANGVRFYVCMNTLDSIQRKTGSRPQVLDGVVGVQTGVAFMLEAVQAGYTHIHP
jgi:intracellular sulfur oxidation DsrE/DsrF family protein